VTNRLLTISLSTGHFLSEDLLCSSCFQGRVLRIKGLAIGTHSSVTDNDHPSLRNFDPTAEETIFFPRLQGG
jgi:hypothetical protein